MDRPGLAQAQQVAEGTVMQVFLRAVSNLAEIWSGNGSDVQS